MGLSGHMRRGSGNGQGLCSWEARGGPDAHGGRLCRWRLGGIRSYNPEQIMLSAAVRRTSRDVSIMKEKLIFSGDSLRGPWIRWHTCNAPGQVDNIASLQVHTHPHTEGQKHMCAHITQPQILGLSVSRGLVNKRDKLECGGGCLCEGPTPFLGSHMTSTSDNSALFHPCWHSQSVKAAVKTCAKLGVTAAPQRRTESESVLGAPWGSRKV